MIQTLSIACFESRKGVGGVRRAAPSQVAALPPCRAKGVMTKMAPARKVPAKGYIQTGPCMPLRGLVDSEDVFKDLLRVMTELDSSCTLIEVGTYDHA